MSDIDGIIRAAADAMEVLQERQRYQEERMDAIVSILEELVRGSDLTPDAIAKVSAISADMQRLKAAAAWRIRGIELRPDPPADQGGS